MPCTSKGGDARALTTVVLDVDGVLTDGRIGYGGGNGETKFFDVKDGLGIRLLLDAGLRVGILSGRQSRANAVRAKELGLSFVCQGERDKAAGFERLLQQQGIEAGQCVVVGDDLADIPVMKRAGVAVAVADAAAEVRQAADWVCSRPGGRGAVREVAEWLLKAKGLWPAVLERYGATE